MKKYLHIWEICCTFAAILDKRVYFTLIVTMILNHLLTYNLLMAGAAANVCMYVLLDRLTRGSKSGRSTDKQAAGASCTCRFVVYN